MDNKEKNNDCGCSVDFRQEVNELVKEGTKPTKTEHDKKQSELDSAFGNSSQQTRK